MNKKKIIQVVSDKTNLSQKDTGIIVNALLKEIAETLNNGEKVQFTGFGTFEARTRMARVSKNPRTGTVMNIPECKAPVFRAGKALKAKVNGQ